MTTQTVQVAGRAIDLEIEGSGPLVLFVQGGAAIHSPYWGPIVPEVSSFATTVRLDRPGVGRSPHTGAPLSLAEQASHLAEVIVSLDKGPAVVAGHSLGGPVTIQLAADYPELVSGVVLFDPTPIDPSSAQKILLPMTKLFGFVTRFGWGKALYGKTMAKSAKRYENDPEAAAAYKELGETTLLFDQWNQVNRLLRTFPADAAKLFARLESTPLKPSGTLVTADRKENNPSYKGHAEVARRTGLQLEKWPNTTHSCQFEEPQKAIAAIRSLV